MEKKMKRLIARQDYQEREIKCLIIEDLEAGTIRKEYDYNKFANILKTYDKDSVTIVFSPTEKQRGHLIDLIGENSDKDGNVFISNETIYHHMFKEFTDLDITNSATDNELLQQAFANPSGLFLAIKSAMEQILWGIVAAYNDTVKTIEAIPAEMLQTSVDLKRLEIEAEKERILKQIEELQKELENVEG